MRTMATLATLLLSGPLAFAQSGVDYCDNPTLTLGDRVAQHIDHGNDGPSVGDQRVGRTTLRTTDGADAGVMVFHSHMLREAADAEAHLVTGQNIFMTERGNLFTVYAQESPNQDYGDADHRPHALTLAVIGGTGAYAGARGEITVAPRAEPATVTVSLLCP
ncbi:MAG: hypothetical protein AAF318_07330 [Pseudomonadota bacterium]